MSILIYKQRHRHPNYKKTPKGNYAHIGYIATRPGAVKNEGMRHGLFGKLEPGAVKEFDTWQEAARLVRELSYRRVNMYRGIISFSPETAAELGLSDHKAWEDYIDRHILTLAKFNGIRPLGLFPSHPAITKKAIPTSMWCSGIKISEQWSLLCIQASRIKSVSSSFEIPLPSVSKSIARPNSGQRNTCRPSQTK